MSNFSQNQEEDFKYYLDSIIHSHLKNAAILGMILISLFFTLDFFTMPANLLTRFAIYRLVTVMVIGIQYLIIANSTPTNKSFIHGHIFTIIVGGMIVLMTVDLGGFDSPYYAGLNLVIITINILVSWRPVHSVISSFMLVIMYVVINLAKGLEYQTVHLINNTYFLISTSIIAISISIARYKLTRREFFLRSELKEARDALWGEMEIAKRIQTALLPDIKKIEGYEISAMMLPADEVGGDFYDIIESHNGQNWVAIGDVSGHGVESGLIMMMVQTSILTMTHNKEIVSPTQILTSVNRVIMQNINKLNTDRYMTITVMSLNGDKMVIAGHHQDILVYRHRLCQIEIIETHGTWLGVIDNIDDYITDRTIPVEEKDLILLFTDGVTEATNLNGEMFGQERLEKALNRYSYLSIPQIIQNILKEVTQFQEKQDDDITLVLLKKS